MSRFSGRGNLETGNHLLPGPQDALAGT